MTRAVTYAPVALFALLGWTHRWVSDDGFIYLRVVDNVHAGAGPVFNEGERVEAYTSALWLAILSLATWVAGFVDREWVAVVLGLAASVGGLALAVRGAELYWRSLGRSGLALPLGALSFVALPPVWDFATSGLETGLTLLWLGGSFWALVALHLRLERGDPPGRRIPLAAVGLGLGPLVRPDLALFALAFLVALVLVAKPASRLRAAGLVALGLALPVAYQVFRMGYFAALAPNPAYAKEAGEADWHRGAHYLRDFASTYVLFVPMAVLLGYATLEVRRIRPDRAVLAIAAAPVAAGFLHGLYVVRVGGDFMHGRLLLPSLFGMLLPAMAVMPSVRRLAIGVAAAILPWAALTGFVLRTPYAGTWKGRSASIADERSYYVERTGDEHPVTLDDYRRLDWLRDGEQARLMASRTRAIVPGAPSQTNFRDPPITVPPPRPGLPERVVIGFGTVGVASYAAGRDVLIADRLGLGDALAARLEIEPGVEWGGTEIVERPGRTGHEKMLPQDWVLARYGDPAAPPATPGVDAARRALGCGRLRELREAIEEPMDAGRFVSNLGVAVRLHGFRFRGDPTITAPEVCGRGESG